MTTSPEVERPAGYRQVLAEPRFRVLFGALSLSITANMLRILALSVLVFSLTGSAFLSALTFGIGFVPQLIGGMLLGSVADRLRPRPLISAGYCLECVVAVVLALTRLPVGISLALVAAVSCFTPVFLGATNKLVAEVLTGDAYVLGRSLASMAASSAQLLGLAAGGLAVAAVGARYALLVSAGCYLVAGVVVRTRLPDLPAPVSHGPARSVLRQSWTGNRVLLGDRAVRRLLIVQWLPASLFVGAESLLVPYGAARGFSTGTPGLLLACVPAGMLAGNLVFGRLVRPSTRERLVAPLVMLLAVPLLAFGMSLPAEVLAVLLAAGAMGFAASLGVQRRFLAVVPDARRGQAFALLSTGLMSLQGVGPLAFGGVAEVLPVGLTMAGGGVALLLAAALIGGWLRRTPMP